MNDNFKEGSWVFYKNPTHQYHMMFFQIKKIVPLRWDPVTQVTVGQEGYNLVYGARSVFATADQMIHRGDPIVQNLVLQGMNIQGDSHVPKDHALIVDCNGNIAAKITNINTSHEGHEVIENYAGGKTFKYCRVCKTEVYE